ncbi:hypothetical protein [Microvirga roseola]|uniref:hypothetical protein n=1 Tax=Microvirga roseola TaxID=2883126 RepID=UPI001E49E904|nr:hypothetical protein [Microvirga roseola]
MRIACAIAVILTAGLSLPASAQERRKPLSPEREAQRELCRQESRRAYKVRGNGVTRSEALHASMREARRAYVRACMQRARAAAR